MNIYKICKYKKICVSLFNLY